MGKSRISTVLMVGSALVLFATSAQGGADFNRPDLLDVSDSSYYTGSGSSAPFVKAYMYGHATWASVWGSMSASARSTDHLVQMFTYLHQPDTMTRNHRRAKGSQKRNTYLQIWIRALPGYTVVASETGVLEDCRVAMTADDRDRDGTFDLDPAGDDTLRGRLKCSRGILSDLGFSPADVDIIQDIIGKRIKLKINLPY